MTEVAQSDLAVESRLLVRRATWCGVVFSLAVLITALNIFPPFPIQYHVRSEVVISASRLARLQERADADQPMLFATTDGAIGDDVAQGQPVAQGQLRDVRLIGVRVLDRTSRISEGPDKSERDLVLVEIESLWAGRCSDESHKDWLLAITKVDEQSLGGSEIARQARRARWELAAAKHYADRHEFLATSTPPRSSRDGRTFELARSPATGGGVPASLASYTTGGTQASGGDSPQDTKSELDEQVHRAKQVVSQLELEWQEQIKQSSGLMEVAIQPEIGVRTGTIPNWMAASIMVLGLASGSLAGWFQYRLQSGGAYDPDFVAAQLELEGVPVAGSVSLPSDQVDQRDWVDMASRRASETSRRAGRNLTRISEWILGFWVLFIAMRILTDPMWRSVLIDSPLAGFARVIAGLP